MKAEIIKSRKIFIKKINYMHNIKTTQTEFKKAHAI